MCDTPENLQVIKQEISPPGTPEDKSTNNIKAKLNLHVKRRLQDFVHSDVKIETTQTSTANTDNTKQKLETKNPETTRQKRPYHKRTDKTNKSGSHIQQSLENATAGATTVPRKYKHKLKQIVTTGNPESLTPNSVDEAVHTAGAVSAGDDDDGGHDNDMRSNREKEKCPDVLAMVLSMKKRSLMQDPEVQNFLKDVLEVIKS